jgi:hypothetical protein
MAAARRLLVGGPVLAGACLAALFLSFAGVFTDAPQGVTGERLLSLGLVAAAHLLLGGLGARFAPGGWPGWGLLVAAPSLLVLGVYASRETQAILLCATYAAVASLGALAGAWTGARWRPTAAG